MASTSQNQSGRAVVAPCGGGIFGWLMSLVGSGTPTYAGDRQPPATRCAWGLFSSTPSYRTAPPKRVPVSDTKADLEGDGVIELVQGNPDPVELLRAVGIIVRREPSPSGDGHGAGPCAG